MSPAPGDAWAFWICSPQYPFLFSCCFHCQSPEQPPASCVKADRNVPPSQEPPAKPNPKAPEAVAPVQAVTSDSPREATKDKGSATPLPLSKLFWKKVLGQGLELILFQNAAEQPNPPWQQLPPAQHQGHEFLGFME